MLIVPASGQGGFVLSDVVLTTEDGRSVLVAELLSGALAALIGVGDHRVGLVPKQETD